MANYGLMSGRVVGILVFAAGLVSSYCLENTRAVDTVNVPEVFRSFEENGNGRKLWLAKYQSAKANCAWQQDIESLEYDYDWFPTNQFMQESYWSYLVSQLLITTYYPQLPSWFVRFLHYLFGPALHGPPLQSYSCRVTDSEGAELRIRRLGPFVGNGGFDWHKMKLQDPYSLGPDIQQGGMHVTGFAVLPVAEDGKALGNPPIHIHHANLGPNAGRNSLQRLSQWHGDSQCADTDGGTACYVTALPTGFGFPISSALRLDVDFNDVRPLRSPDLNFWLETSVSIAKPTTAQPNVQKVRDVGTVILGVPFRGQWWKSSDLQRLYFIPSDQPSALWVTGRMPTAGTFVAGGKIEVHQHMLDAAWVFTGISPEDLGLNSDVWQLEKPWLPWVPSDNGFPNTTSAMATLKSHVLGNFEKAVQKCKVDPSCSTAPTLMWKLNRTVFEDGEERQMRWPENTWKFKLGEQFTTVIFHKVMSHEHSGHEHKAELPQHLAITGHYIPAEGARADYWYVLPSTNADWQWINSVNWLHALTHYGGPPAEFWSWPAAFALVWSIMLTYVVTRCIAKLLDAYVLRRCTDKNRNPVRCCYGMRKYVAIDHQAEQKHTQHAETAPCVHGNELSQDDFA